MDERAVELTGDTEGVTLTLSEEALTIHLPSPEPHKVIGIRVVEGAPVPPGVIRIVGGREIISLQGESDQDGSGG